MALRSRNNYGRSMGTNTPHLPEAPQGWLKSNTDRLLIALNVKKPGPKNLADRDFIKTVEKSGRKAQNAMKDADEQLVDWNAASQRYEEIVAYVQAITTSQSVSIDQIIASQEAIERFQEQLEVLIGTLHSNDATIWSKLKEIQQNTQQLWDDQKQLEKLFKDGNSVQ